MTTYQYNALDEAGKAVRGTVEADDEKCAAALVREAGLIPVEIRERQSKQPDAIDGAVAVLVLGIVLAGAYYFLRPMLDEMQLEAGRSTETPLANSGVSGTEQTPPPIEADSGDPSVTGKRGRLEAQLAKLRERIDEGIPTFRDHLARQAAQVRDELPGAASAETRAMLERELTQIERMTDGLDAHEKECRDATIAINSSLRQLDRLSQTIDMFHDASARQVLDEANLTEQQAASLIEVELAR